MSVAADYIEIAKSKTSAPWYKTLILAVMAGAFIALGGALATIAAADLSCSPAALFKGAVFPLGLMLVVVCGAELFTGNCLFALPLLNRDIRVGRALKNLGIVYGGNLVGGVLIAMLVVYSHSIGGNAAASGGIAIAKTSLGLRRAFLRE